MIDISEFTDEGIIIVEPSGPLEQTDFEKLAAKIDDFPKAGGHLVGLIIHTKLFPGWADFAAFLQHMKFVNEHHKQIQRVAIVTDSAIGAIAPAIAQLFVSAEIQHFDYDTLDAAREWAKSSVS